MANKAQDADRTLKTGDSYPPLVRVLVNQDGIPVHLAGFTVRVIALKGTRNAPIRRITDNCSIMTIAAALATGHLAPGEDDDWTDHLLTQAAVMWDIEPLDTSAADAEGTYAYEFEVTRAIGDVQTFPTKASDNPTLTVDPDLDAPV